MNLLRGLTLIIYPMQFALIIPEAEWKALVADVEQLKQEATAAKAAIPAPLLDRLLNVREAAAYTHLTPEGIRKARRASRISGVKLNEKEWGFRESELERYLNRYNRRSMGGSRLLPPLPQIL